MSLYGAIEVRDDNIDDRLLVAESAKLVAKDGHGCFTACPSESRAAKWIICLRRRDAPGTGFTHGAYAPNVVHHV